MGTIVPRLLSNSSIFTTALGAKANVADLAAPGGAARIGTAEGVTLEQELALKFDINSFLAWGANLTDIQGGEPPTGRAWYLDGGILKFKAS